MAMLPGDALGATDHHSARRAVLLVTAAVFINYIDRGNLATVAPLMRHELNLNEEQLGILFSAFFFGYVPCMPATGWLADRYGARIVLALSLAVWSLATLATGFATGFVMLLGLRVILGIGESAAFPCASKILADAVEVGRLGVANGIMSFGYLIGPAIGTLIGGYLMTIAGWRPTFLVFGALSLLWLWPWLRSGPVAARREVTANAPAAAPASSEILRQRGLWGACAGHFASNYIYYFILYWLPTYLVEARGFSIGSMAVIASSAYLLNAGSALFMGWMADRWIRAGRSPTLIYKSIMAITHISCFACMAGMSLLSQTGSLVALFAYALIAGCSYPGIFAIPQIMAGPNAAGRWVGVQNAAGNVAGFIAPVLTGFLVYHTHRYDVAFALAAGVNVLGLIGWVFVLPRIELLKWRTIAATRAPA